MVQVSEPRFRFLSRAWLDTPLARKAWRQLELLERLVERDGVTDSRVRRYERWHATLMGEHERVRQAR